MKRPRFFCRPIKAGELVLEKDQGRHAAEVLRLGEGDEVELFDGLGTTAQGRISEVTKKRVTVEIFQQETLCPPATGRIVIAAAMVKGERFDWLVSKCTELGADRIVPVITERTVKLGKGSQSLQRYERLALAACKQSGRVFLPVIDPPMKLEASLEHLLQDNRVDNELPTLPGYSKPQLVFGSLSGRAWDGSLIDAGRDVIAFVGPEGGFTESEEHRLMEQGATPCRLTVTTLRVETAAIAWASLLAIHRNRC